MDGKHYFFNLNGTLCHPGRLCSKEMLDALTLLAKKSHVVIVSGNEYKQVKAQMSRLSAFTVLSQDGTAADRGWRTLWRRNLNVVHKSVISEHIRLIKSISGITPKDPNDIVQDRGGLISYSLIGHNASQEEKDAFDPFGLVREKLIEAIPLDSLTCRVEISGRTSLDYVASTWGLESNVSRLLDVQKWNIDDCMYIADNLMSDTFGNDAVQDFFGGTRCYAIDNPRATLEFIKTLIS